MQLQKGPLISGNCLQGQAPNLPTQQQLQPPGMTTVNGKATPNVIGGYNKNMGGVDKSNQHQAYYPLGQHNKKWWRYIFHSFVNLCIVQAYLTWERSPHNPEPKKTYRDHLWSALTSLSSSVLDSHATGRSRAVPEAPITMATIKHHKLVT